MLTFPDLKVGVFIIIDGQPYEIIEAQHSKVAQRRAVLQTRVKNIITGAVLSKNITHMDKFEEAEMELKKVKYLYNNRGQFWFCEPDNPANRFSVEESAVGDAKNFLKANTVVDAIIFDKNIVGVKIPIKENFRVVEAPPGVKGDSAQGATKAVKIETGATITVPLFINQDDVIAVNTETGEYVARVEKSK